MRWHNIDAGPGYYFITGTVTEWLPLFAREDICSALIYETKVALRRMNASVAAYVIMPNHIHLLAGLPDARSLRAFNRLWRGRSARTIVDHLKRQGDQDVLAVLARHANGASHYALWKEQTRDLAVFTRKKLRVQIDYIHANPVRAGLAECPEDWLHSSYRFYEDGSATDFTIVPVEP